MKKRSKKLLSLLLTSALIVQTLGFAPAYADDSPPSEPPATQEISFDELGEPSVTTPSGGTSLEPKKDVDQENDNSVVGGIASVFGGIMTPFAAKERVEGTDFTIINPVFKIGNVDLISGSEPYPVLNIGDRVDLSMNFNIINEFEAGDTIKITLPEIFNRSNLVDSGNDPFWSFVVDSNNVVTLTAKQSISNWDDGAVKKYPSFSAWGQLNLTTTSTSNEVTIKIPFSQDKDKDYTIKFKPDVKDGSVSKLAVGVDPSKNVLSWKTTINQLKQTVAGAKMVDTFVDASGTSYGNHKLKAGSVVVKKAEVALNGTVTSGNTVDSANYTVTNKGLDGFEVSFTNPDPITDAYIIEYETEIVKRNQPSSGATVNTTYYNKSELLGTDFTESTATATANQTVASDASLVKSHITPSFNAKEITWKIVVNQPGDPLTNVVVSDTLGTDLAFKAGSMRIYEYDKNASIGTDGYPTTVQISVLEDGTTLPVTFPVNLKNITKPYVIYYTTAIKTADENALDKLNGISDSKVYDNTATMESTEYPLVNGNPTMSSYDKVTVYRGNALAKTNGKYIPDRKGANHGWYEWEIIFNAKENTIPTNFVLTDKLGLGLKNPESVKIEKIKYTSDGKIATNPAPVEASADFTVNLDDKTANIAVEPKVQGEVTFTKKAASNDTYRIVYRTQIINKNIAYGPYSNTVGGTGIGSTTRTTTETHSTNSIQKTNVGINFAKGTIEWKIELDIRGDRVDNLVIEDSFPKKGLIFDAEAANAFKVTNIGITPNVSANNIIKNVTSNGDAGFKLEFIDGIHGQYEITYETKYDRKSHTEFTDTNNPSNPSIYHNRADATWKELGKDGFKNTDAQALATQSVQKRAQMNGSKSGVLNRNAREIEWTVTLNYLKEDIDNLKLVEKEFSEKGYELIPSSIEVYKLDIQDKTIQTPTETGANQPTETRVTPKLTNGFTLNNATTNGFELNIPNAKHAYQVVYRTKLVGEARSSYDNIAYVTDNGTPNRELTANVPYGQHDAYLDKTQVRSGAKITWTVTFNTAMSEIYNAVLTDELSEGHVYDAGSIKILDVTNGNSNVPPTAYTVEISTVKNAVGKDVQKMEIKFKNKIEHQYKLIYDSEITKATGNGTLSNKIHMKGDNITVTIEEKEVTTPVIDFGGATSGGYSPKKAIEVKKVDSEGNPLEGAEFKLTDASGGSVTHKSGGGTVQNQFSDENGIVRFENLNNGTYHVVEVKAPNGYLLVGDLTRIFELKSSDKDGDNLKVLYTQDTESKGSITNTKDPNAKAIQLKKVGSDDKTKGLAGAVFELFDSAGTSLGTKTSDENGLVEFLVTQNGTYTIKEITAPQGYKKNTNVITVTVVASTATVYDANVTSPVVNDKQIEREIQLKKVGSNDKTKGLEGASFILTGKDSNGYDVNKTEKSDPNGMVSFKGLYEGTYTIEEMTAPTNYTKSNEKIVVVINDDTKALYDERVGNPVVNQYSPPPTGGGGRTPDPDPEPEVPPTTEVPPTPEIPQTPEIPTPPPITEIPPNPTPSTPRIHNGINIDDESIPFADRLKAYEEWLELNPDGIPLAHAVPKTGIGYQPITITVSDNLVQVILPDAVESGKWTADRKRKNRSSRW